MNNDFDFNQQPQAEAPAAPQAPQYQAPLYEKPALDAKPFFTMAIIGLAFSASFYLSFVGIIISAIAMAKGKTYFSLGGACEGKAKAAKILSTIGLWVGIAETVLFLIYIICVIVFVVLTMAGGGASYSDMPGYFY